MIMEPLVTSHILQVLSPAIVITWLDNALHLTELHAAKKVPCVNTALTAYRQTTHDSRNTKSAGRRYDLGGWWPVYSRRTTQPFKVRFKRLDLRFLEIGALRVVFTKRDPEFPGMSGQVV
eukprot:sb/3476161/